MKKSLIALAVLAASGASFAQSSVTVYGIADAYFGSMKAVDATTGTVLTQTVLGNGGISGSRFGFTGSEDLGGGLKANFKLEQGFSIDTGAQSTAGQAFGRYAYVGFSGGFGEVKLGKTGTAYDDISGAGNSAFDSSFSANNDVFLSGGYQWNPANTIYYASPSMSGFSAAVSYSLGENKDTPVAGVGAGSITSFNVAYAAGPLAAALGYQAEKATAAVDATTYTRLNGSYDFGVAKVLAGYGRVVDGAVAGSLTTEWELGADFPVSSALTISGGLARSSSSDDTAATDAVRKGYGIAALYTLSKRTSLYGGYRSATMAPAVGADIDTSLFAVGVKHTF